MARYGTWRPLAANWESQPRLQKYDLLIFHTMAGSLNGSESFFKENGYGGAESHFGIGPDGECRQWQDTAHQANANIAADKRAISVETADYGPGFPRWNLNDASAIPAWTPAQLDRLVNLTVWACRTHWIPCVLVQDSKPERRGIGYHRLGVPGYAVAGGELWSSARGKVCPGNRRIAQIPTIVGRAAAELNAGVPATTFTKPVANVTALPGATLRNGMTGSDVIRLQTLLTTKYPSYAKFRVTGYFGDATEASVREFQKRSKLTSDGVVGPMTRRVLGM